VIRRKFLKNKKGALRPSVAVTGACCACENLIHQSRLL
jgi:hypothetical protein